MKKIFFLVVLFSTTLFKQGFAQDTTVQHQFSHLLHSYYDIKNALVSGNASTTAKNAEQFVTTLNGIDEKTINKESRDALLKDATHISKTDELKHQREHFANFSTNMIALAKSVKLSSQPIYEAYCPMKKAYWLSNEKAIKNPYYGSAMLTCGSVKETL